MKTITSHKMKSKNLILLTILLVLSTFRVTSQPGWTVTPGDFQYNMSVTAVVEIDGTEVVDNNNILGAFFGGQCRGTASLQAVPQGTVVRYIAFLTVYSNTPVGEDIEFKFYDGNSTFTHSCTTTVSFILDGIIGSPDTPQLIAAVGMDSNTVPTIKTGYENRVKSINTNDIVIVSGLNTSELLESLEAPKDQSGAIVGSLLLEDASGTPIPMGTIVTDAVKVRSTAQNNDYNIYDLIISSDVATLSDLQTSDGTLSPAFASTTFTYDVIVDATVLQANVSGTLSDANASMLVTQAASIPGTATIVVTSQDLSNTETYSVNYSYQVSSDEAALKELYSFTNGSNWKNKTNWLQDDIDTWYGIKAPSGRVERINLKYNALNGTIPPTLGSLSELKFLHLRGNQISGPLPGTLGDLTNLTFLAISENPINSDLPASFNKLTKLKEFYAVKCGLTGLPDLSALVNMDYLYVGGNNLDFGDLETFVDFGMFQFSYAPQAEVGNEEDINVPLGGLFSYTLTTGGTVNKYQWYKNGTKISGKTEATISIPAVSSGDAGIYTCKITNSLLPNLTLQSKPVTLVIGSAIAPFNLNDWYMDIENLGAGTHNKLVYYGDATDMKVLKLLLEHPLGRNVAFAIEVPVDGQIPEKIHPESNPSIQSYSYRIQFLNENDEESPFSIIHKTIHLTINQGHLGQVNLIWSKYEGKEVAYYEVLTGTSSDLTQMTVLETLAPDATSYSDYSPAAYYAIRATFVTPPGQKSGQLLQSTSNLFSGEDVAFMPAKNIVKVYPNPISQLAMIEFSNPEGLEYTLMIRDITGCIHLRQDHITSQQVMVNKGDLPPGYYIVQIIGEKSGSKLVVIK